MALREIPFGLIRPSPRYLDLTYENSIDRTREPWMLHYERRGVPIRDILTGRRRITRFRQSSQLQVVITIMHVFFDCMRENWTRGKERYLEIEENFSKNLFNVLVSIKRNIIWSVGGKPPIDRDTYETLKKCYEFEPFRKYWSRRKKRRAKGYMNTIKFYYENVNTEGQAEMRHQIDRDDELTYVEDLG